MNLRLGTAKVDITPTHPIPLGGYLRTGNYEGIKQRLYLRAFVFDHGRTDAKSAKALIVSADLIWWGEDVAPDLLGKLESGFGFADGSVILHGTHNHSSPQTSFCLSPYLGDADADYVRLLEERLFQAVRQAEDSMEPVSAEGGTACCGFNKVRRTWVNGKNEFLPNDEARTDKDVRVVRFVGPAGKTKALIVHYVCHPTVTGENFVSSDYCGVAMEQVEEAVGDGAVAAFLQGCCGDVRPDVIRDGKFYRGTGDQVVEYGTKLARIVLDTLSRPLEALASEGEVAFETRSVALPYETLPSAERLEQIRLTGSGPEAAWATKLLQETKNLAPSVDLRMNRIRLTRELVLLGMNAEMTSPYGFYVKDHYPRHVLTVPYSNGMIGYVASAAQLGEGGYEAGESIIYFHLPAPFQTVIEERIQRAVRELMRG